MIGPRNVSGPLPIFFQRLNDGQALLRHHGAARLRLRQAIWRASWCARPTAPGHGTYHFSSGTDVAIQELYDAVVAAMKLNAYPEPEVRAARAGRCAVDPARPVADLRGFRRRSASRRLPETVARGGRLLPAARRARRLHPSAGARSERRAILITGGAGCLGSNLIEHWLPHGHEILVIDNFATGKREVVPPVAGLTLIEGSVADAALVDRVFASVRADARHPQRGRLQGSERLARGRRGPT